MAVSIKIIDIS